METSKLNKTLEEIEAIKLGHLVAMKTKTKLRNARAFAEKLQTAKINLPIFCAEERYYRIYNEIQYASWVAADYIISDDPKESSNEFLRPIAKTVTSIDWDHNFDIDNLCLCARMAIAQLDNMTKSMEHHIRQKRRSISK